MGVIRVSGAVVLGFLLFLFGYARFLEWTDETTADPASGAQPGRVAVDDSKKDRYRELARSIGLDYDREYRWTDWYDTRHRIALGTSGEFETLGCSTGPIDPVSRLCNVLGVDRYWESIYFGNHDVTVMYASYDVGDRSFVHLLRLAEGRAPDLHRR
jgi:hypothetical protein